ncbi:hypothetical protein ACTJ2Z_003690 [Vibrio vulnificus]
MTMKPLSLLAIIASSLSLSVQAESNTANAFSVSYNQPDSGLCQFSEDLGATTFDVRSGKLWACSEMGWVYFESVSPLQCDGLRTEEELANYKAWKKGSYRSGALVVHNRQLYKARSWTNGEPGKAEEWELEGIYPTGPSRWSSVEQYHSGSQVVYMGHVYQSSSWSKNTNPAKEANKSGWKKWKYVGPFECPNS